MHLTKKNHVQFSRPAGKLSVSLGRCSRDPYDWRTECLLSATDIAKIAGSRPLAVTLSGGVDSEIVAECFRLARMPFEVFTLQFPQDLNQHDIEWAIKYCQKHSIKQTLIPFDVVSFFENGEMEKMALEYQCRWPQLTPHMWLASELDQKGYHSIFGCFDIFPVKKESSWTLPFYEPEFAFFEYFQKNKIHGTPGFFIWSPEQIYSYITAPAFLRQMPDRQNFVVDHYAARRDIYSDYFQFERKPKYNGYEQLYNLELKALLELKSQLKHKNNSMDFSVARLQKEMRFHGA